MRTGPSPAVCWIELQLPVWLAAVPAGRGLVVCSAAVTAAAAAAAGGAAAVAAAGWHAVSAQLCVPPATCA